MPFLRFRRCPLSPLLPLSAVLLPLLLSCSGCTVSASSGVQSSQDAQQQQSSTGTLEPQFFGMVVKSAAVTPAVSIGSRRLWDAGVTWAAIEPSSGVFQWQTLDAEVAAAREQGQQVVLTLGMTPAWASSDLAQPSSYGSGATAMPANLADWDAYVSAVAARYAGQIAAYEVWNAPENPAYWSGSAAALGENMAALAGHARADIRAADAAALLVSPAMSSDGLAAFLSAGGGASVDVIGASLDAPGQAPEAMTATLAALRQTLVGTSTAALPIWNEQAAWELPPAGLAATTQAAYVARALLLNAGYGVARMHWYAWDDSSQGALALTDSQILPTQAAVAYGEVENWLAGAQMNGCSASAEGVWSCQLVQGGHTEWVVWSTEGNLATSTNGASTQTDLEGNVTTIGAVSSVQVGASPVLLQ